MCENYNSIDKVNHLVIKNYENDEKMMVLLFAQWCINHDLDPIELYEQAYPHQATNELLVDMLEETVSKEVSDHISHETILNVMQAFGNDDLAFVIHEAINKNRL